MIKSSCNNTLQKILFVSHKEKQCGVHEFGLSIAEALKKSAEYSFVYAECSCPEEFFSIVKGEKPSAVIYNYYPSTMPWLRKEVVKKFDIPHLGIMHEVTQQAADLADTRLFDYHIAPDPTLSPRNPIVFKTGRLIPTYTNMFRLPQTTTIGTFGFATGGKGFERLIVSVQEEFDEAIIRLHIPFGDFADSNAEEVARRCRGLVVKKGIKLVVTHDFLGKQQLLDFLAQNTLNAFFYDKGEGRGISSVIENALAAHRPIAITNSKMFRHVLTGNLFRIDSPFCIENDTDPVLAFKQRIVLRLRRRRYLLHSKSEIPLKWLLKPKTSLKQIIENGIKPLVPFLSEWSEPNLIMDYERIFNRVLGKLRDPNDALYPHESEKGKYSLVGIPGVTSFNRILDETARSQYKPAIDILSTHAPNLLIRKIPEANIQQAFVMDTVQKFASQISSPRILCVGSYEDTAAASLKKLGYQMEEVDPVLNYDLSEFFHMPSTSKGSYDIIFSTSVIEHVRNDELFITQIVELLSPGGIAILTLDYNDQYTLGDPIPPEDFRLYTKKDLMEWLLPLLKDCSLVDKPQWDCPNPDFTYAGCRYTFASLVFQRHSA